MKKDQHSRLRKERVDRGIKVRSDSIFVLCSWREMFYLASPRILPVLATVVAYFLFPLYWQKVLVIASMTAILALSWDLLASVGLMSLGQSLLFGAGAYTAGALNHYLHWPIVVSIPVGALIAGLLCTFLILPLLRLRGIYFSIVTLILPLLLLRVIEATKILGGTEGIFGLSPFPNIYWEFGVILIVLWATMFFLRRLIATDYGIVVTGIKDNDRAVMAGGINIYWYKVQVVFYASFIGAFTGAFMAHFHMFTGMSTFSLDYSILPVAAAVLGGIGSFAGPVLGAFLLVPLSELLREFGSLRIVVYSVILVFCVVALPEGIFHFIARKYHQFERWVEVER
jgi:branched-chain amino acid transport system permease protein